jgi:hypothetical protein
MLEKLTLSPNILFNSRLAYRKIKQAPELDFSLALVVALGVVMSFGLLNNPEAEVWLKILMLVLGIVGALFGTLLFAYLLHWISNMFLRETKDFNPIRLMLPYAYLPFIVAMLLRISLPPTAGLIVCVAAVIWGVVILTLFISEIKKGDLVKSFYAT